MASHLETQPNVVLYRGFKDSGAYTWSPFVNKLEARFRFARVAYRPSVGSPLKAPRGKVPYIEISSQDSDALTNPQVLGDSSLIIKKLVDEGILEDLNVRLSPMEQATDLAIRALLEDKLYFYLVYERWYQNYYTMRPGVLHALPYPVQVIVGLLAYRKVSATLYGQGTTRYSSEEIGALKLSVWESINILLETSKRNEQTSVPGSPFWVFGGRRPTEADATLFGFVSSALVCNAGPDTRQVVRSFPIIVDYAQRIHDAYYPDFVLWE